MLSGLPACKARACNIARSPTITKRAWKSCAASLTQSSGPMPAGSPLVTAMVGSMALQEFEFRLPVFQVVFDISLVALLAQPFLICLVRFTRAQGLARLLALAVGRFAFFPALQHFDQVQAERGLHGTGDFADFQ